jgi:hypothetical protein
MVPTFSFTEMPVFNDARRNKRKRIVTSSTSFAGLPLSLLLVLTTACCYSNAFTGAIMKRNDRPNRQQEKLHRRHHLQLKSEESSFSRSSMSSSSSSIDTERPVDLLKKDLFGLLDTIPANVPTPPDTTKKLLDIVRQIEDTRVDIQGQGENEKDEDDEFLNKIGGTWELVWTTQDRESRTFNEQASWRTFIKYVCLDYPRCFDTVFKFIIARTSGFDFCWFRW